MLGRIGSVAPGAKRSGVPVALGAEGPAKSAGFADVVEKVKPAVITVRAEVKQANRSGQPRGMHRSDRTPRGTIPEQYDPPGSPDHATSLGSGFFIQKDGYAVTTNHVIEHTSSIEISADDGKVYPARLVGSDPKTDLALIKVDGGGEFPAVRFADKTPRVGEWVLAIGNPFGLGGTVTAGIVSGRARDIGVGDDFLQIDAPINQGNSGGPAFDLNGEVIGVTSAIVSPSGGSVGIGFSIPAEAVKPVVAQLLEKGKVSRGWLGIEVRPVSLQIPQDVGFKNVQGALVTRPQAKSPAAEAGIISGDVITSLDSQPITDTRDLMRRIAAMAPDTSVRLGVYRKGEEKTFAVTLGELPSSGNPTGENRDTR
jgi:serine protease Do